ncbi:tail fiber/spike domain-containing protein [Enterobacter hormaechei]|uniref:tail fiber/spike domain-containing protein n=1 Tax=Enterobacter hormaechei TaxID=158836 RepID=UPI00403A8B97
MATTPTQNSVPSESPLDLKYNAGKIDEFVTSLVNTYVDRFGHEHYTIEGLRWLAQQAIAQYGWILIDSFQVGADITLPNQALRDEATGEYYRWDGALPKHVDAGSTPATSGGVGVGAWIGVGDASLRAMLSSESGAALSLSQVATSYGLDFSLGGVWTAGATSTADNWWWYNNKVYTGGSGTLPAAPAAQWYPIRPGYKLNLTDFITTEGATDILDVVDWQWAFDSAKLNARHTSMIDMDAREYTMSAAGFVAAQGVGLRGPKDAMMNPSLDGVAVIYINKSPSASDVFVTMRGGNIFEDFGIFFAQQTYTTLASVVDTGIMFKRVPASGTGDAIFTKACIIRGVSACGVAKLWYSSIADNAAGEYDEIKRVSATPNRFGPTFRYGISTDFLRTKTVHINANVVSAYRARYGVDITVRGLNSSNLAAIGFLIERMDGGLFEDILTYGVPYAVVLGAVGATGGANAAGANFVSCGFDATCFPIYINCPTGAFGVSFSNCQAVYDEQYGDTSGALVYLGAAANAHHVMLSNFKVQKTASFNYRPVRAVTGSLNNRVTISTSALTASQDVLDEGSGNRISILGSTRNLGGLNLMTNTTADSSLMSSMGEINTLVKQSVTITVPSGSTFVNLAVTYPYTGWQSAPSIITEVTGVSITGQSDSTLYGARTFSRTTTGCIVRLALSIAAAAAGTVTVDLYINGTVRGVLTAV